MKDRDIKSKLSKMSTSHSDFVKHLFKKFVDDIATKLAEDTRNPVTFTDVIDSKNKQSVTLHNVAKSKNGDIPDEHAELISKLATNSEIKKIIDANI